MTDIVSKEQRSNIMSRIGSKNTKPEILVRKYLHVHGLRYRKNVKKLPGQPDIVLSKFKTIVFIHGCFWHGHETCKKMPKSNVEFWQNKISKNRARDEIAKEELERNGWKVIIVWECEISSAKKRDNRLPALIEEIKEGK